MNDNRTILYNALKNEGYTDIGENQEEFNKLLEKPENVRVAYDAMRNSGYTDIGDSYEAFAAMLVPDVEQKTTAPVPAQQPKGGENGFTLTAEELELEEEAVEEPKKEEPEKVSAGESVQTKKRTSGGVSGLVRMQAPGQKPVSGSYQMGQRYNPTVNIPKAEEEISAADMARQRELMSKQYREGMTTGAALNRQADQYRNMASVFDRSKSAQIFGKRPNLDENYIGTEKREYGSADVRELKAAEKRVAEQVEKGEITQKEAEDKMKKEHVMYDNAQKVAAGEDKGGMGKKYEDARAVSDEAHRKALEEFDKKLQSTDYLLFPGQKKEDVAPIPEEFRYDYDFKKEFGYFPQGTDTEFWGFLKTKTGKEYQEDVLGVVLNDTELEKLREEATRLGFGGSLAQNFRKLGYDIQNVEAELLNLVANISGSEDAKKKVQERWEAINRKRDSFKPTAEGVGGFVAEMIPQMTGIGLGVLASFVNPNIGAAIITTSTGAQIASSMGAEANEARRAGASDGQVALAMLLNGSVEFLTEKFVNTKYVKRVLPSFGKMMTETSGDVIDKEFNDLLSAAREKFGDKFTAKTAKGFIKDVIEEGGSEFAAEALQTLIPMIYENPEDYPTLSQVFENGLQGFLGGAFMGGVLGPSSSLVQRRANNKRRVAQGKVHVALVTIDGQDTVVEITGKKDDNTFVALVDNSFMPVKKENIKAMESYDYDFFKSLEIEASREEGYNTDPDTVNGSTIALANKSLDESRASVRAALNLGEDADVDAVIAGKEFEGEAKAAVDTYLAEKAKVEGMRDRFNEQRDSEIAEADNSVDAVAHEDGNVYMTTLPSTGEVIYITGGTVVLDNDGYIDVNQSEGLVALMPNGKKEAIQAGNIREKVAVENAEAQKAAKRAEIDARYESQLNTFVYSDSEGDHTVMLVGRRGDMVDALIDGRPTEVPAKEFEAIMADATGKQPVVEGGEVKAEGATSGDVVSPVETTQPIEQPGLSNGLSNETAQTETSQPQAVAPKVAEVSDFFRMDGKNYAVVSRNEDGSVTVVVDGKSAVLPAETNFTAAVPTDKGGKVLFTEMPAEKTLEYFVQRVPNGQARAQMIENNRKQAESALTKYDKEPNVGTDPDAYEATMNKWEADKKAAQAKVDYWNEVAKRDAEISQSEMRESVEAVKPREVVEMTPDEFVANQLGGIKITPESFQKETGTKAEQKQMVGVIAGKEKGGVSIERAAEIIYESYGDELRGLGFNGDMQDVRDMIIDVLSNGNPRSFAKKGLEMRQQADVEQQLAELRGVANALNFESIEEQIAYEESIVPRIMQELKGFDETEYFNNLAENYENDTTRESENTRGSSELLQGEQSADNAGATNLGEPGQGGEVQGDVYSGGENATPQGNQQVNGSEIPNGSTISQASEQVIDHYTLNSAGNSTQMLKDMEAFDNFFATVEEKTEDGQTVLFQQGMIELDRENPAFERATENVRKKLEATGVKVKVLTKEEAESELARLEELADMQKRTAPETESVQDEHQPSVVSSADGAKILKDLDSAIKEYDENANKRPNTFLGDVAKVLGATKHGSNSQYATFEAMNGKVFTIRLANHNAKVSTFDNHNEDEGISIVVTAQDNNGIINDGNAHLVEFFYDAIKLRKADGKPLVEILKSIKQALYSGEYKDNTGLAQPEEVNIPEFLRTSDGTTYGWAVNGEIYLTPEGLNPNTPIHEYTHLWAAALQKSNPKLWSEVVEAMKLSPAWNEVMADENYTDIHGDDNRVASEVLSRLSGNEGYRRYMEQAEAEIAAERNIGEKVRKKGALNFFKRIWNKFRNWLQSVFKSGKVKAGDGTEAKAEPWDVFVNKSLKDFDEGVNPDAKDSPLDWMFIGKKGAEMQEGETLFSKKELTPEQKKKQEALKENAKAIRRLHNVTSRFPITALRNFGFALETQEQREMHDRLFAERDAITGESMPAGLQTNPQAMTLQERITESLLKHAEQEKENVEMRLSAIRAYGRDLANVIKLMNAQKGYDKRTVRIFTDLVKMYLRNNAMSGMSSYKIIRLLNLMQKATGGNATMVNRAAVKIAEIITNEHTSQLEAIMEKQMKTGAERVNASGVVVQGGVDIIGKRILNTYKDAINLDDKGFEEKYNDSFKRVGEIQKQLEENGSNTALENQLEEARAEADAMLLAATYRNEVKAAEADITKIKDELTGKRTKAEKGEITWKEYHEFAKTINSQIVQLRAQQIDAYQKVLHALSGDIYEGAQRARAFREAEAMRVQRIHDMAESDMNGVDKSAERKEPGAAGKTVDMVVYKNPIVRTVMNGLGTYENYMKYFGRDHLDGRGELFEYFITAFNQAQDKEWKESQNDFNILEAAAQEIFGKKRIGKTYKSIARESTEPSGVILKYWNGGATVERELTIGQLMYLYMAEKQAEGQMKLRNMGLTEEKVQGAVEQLPTKYKQFADYIQSQFLPQMRPRMNEVHQRMFGASMSEVENYFPLKVNMGARQGNDDLNNTADTIPSTITGSVIKRRVNVTPIDLMANAFDVLNEHIVDMEHWAAYAEFIRDNNTLINDKDFKNRVQNTKSVRYGDGETLWKNFVDTARIAAGSYKSKADYLAKLMSGANAAKITFGYYTALKQLASMPAFWSDAKIWDAVWYSVNPMGSWRWAIENLPGFEERWKGRTAGNERLGENEYSIHDSRIMKAARMVGMTPNAFVDAVVVASGARAVYKDRLNFYKKLGMTEYEADRRAKNDAAISYNETQQSGQGAYLSTLQKDGGLVALLTTLFRNSQMAFQRRVVGSMVEVGKKLARGEKIREATKQKYIKMGMSEEAAGKQANRDFCKAYAKDITNLAIFGYAMNYVWALMGELPYLLFGDDDEEKEKIWDTAAKMGVTGMFEGFTCGNFAKSLYEKHITDGKYAVGLLEAPFEGDLQVVFERFEKDGTIAGVLQLAMFATEMNTGISPQRLIDTVTAFIYYSNGDIDKATRAQLFALRLLKAPQSQQDKLILDETDGADVEEVKSIAEWYIKYKMARNFPLGSEDEKRVDKYANKFVETLKERVEKEYSPEDISVIFDQSSDTEKEILKKKWIEGMDERNGTNVAKSLRKEKLEELLGSPVENAATKALHKYSKVNTYEKLETFEDLERWYEHKVLHDKFKSDYEKIRDGEELSPEERAKAVEHYGVYADKGFKEVINAIGAHKKFIKQNKDPEWRMSEVRRLTDIATEIMKRYE